MGNIITVRTAELAVSHNDDSVRTGSIGSCIVIVLYDAVSKIGGLAHSMLPYRDEHHKAGPNEADQPAKFADEGVDNLILEIQRQGGIKENLSAKLIGGASMFSKIAGGTQSIGNRNVEAARKRLTELAIPIDKEDTGGTAGKSVVINLASGVVQVSSVM
ncbi:chemotaxis protein CheD [Candidatus Gracilibacteria bacterium]|nr:chemotaxis protein CheD [Candidatus Gracilibacteria bacterium]